MFIPGNTVGKIVGLQHILTIPLCIAALYLMPIKTIHSWRLSFAQMSSIFIVTRFLTPYESNINYAYKLGFSDAVPSPFYPLYWFITIFIVIVFTNVLLIRLLKYTHLRFMVKRFSRMK